MINKDGNTHSSVTPVALHDKDERILNSHYASSLPQWRFAIRQLIIPFIRAEASYLAILQSRWRTPLLDNYFAITANLGTHTFYMIVLPIFFWFGYENVGRAMVHVLATGVCVSGVFKDLLCLPRPPSPPLQRITMSGHVSLEYGFPSTHATNAVSVAVYALIAIRLLEYPLLLHSELIIETSIVVYVLSIVLGRLYCGMHGFLDVIGGSVLGAFLGFAQHLLESPFNSWISHGTILYPLSAIIVILLFIRLHPEPVDDCPCFDDTVAFAAVILGVEVGSWQQTHLLSSFISLHLLEKYDYPIAKAILRVSLGVLTIFAWRGSMKSILLRRLPPIFRNIEKLGLALPRKYFIRATHYHKVPKHLNDNDIIPPAGEIPSLFSCLRHPRRRAVSVGPQSMADAYETIELLRQKQQHLMLSTGEPSTSHVKADARLGKGTNLKAENVRAIEELSEESHMRDIVEKSLLSANALPEMQNTTFNKLDNDSNIVNVERSYPKKPRVRYDVEVVTRIIIYSGIGWLAVSLIPDIFAAIGISAKHR